MKKPQLNKRRRHDTASRTLLSDGARTLAIAVRKVGLLPQRQLSRRLFWHGRTANRDVSSALVQAAALSLLPPANADFDPTHRREEGATQKLERLGGAILPQSLCGEVPHFSTQAG
jgi:hypothetical protein